MWNCATASEQGCPTRPSTTGRPEDACPAIEAEVQEWIEQRGEHRAEHGRQQVARSCFLPERSLLTGIGESAGSPSPTGRRCCCLQSRTSKKRKKNVQFSVRLPL